MKICVIFLCSLLPSISLELSSGISNCVGYGESYSVKGKEICDQCENGYILASSEVSCQQSESICQALDSNIQG